MTILTHTQCHACTLILHVSLCICTGILSNLNGMYKRILGMHIVGGAIVSVSQLLAPPKSYIQIKPTVKGRGQHYYIGTEHADVSLSYHLPPLLLEGLVFLLDEVGSGMSVRTIDNQLTKEINVELCHPLWVGKRHGNQLGHYDLEHVEIHDCTIIVGYMYSVCTGYKHSVHHMHWSTYRIVGIFRGGKFSWTLRLLLVCDKNFVVESSLDTV